MKLFHKKQYAETFGDVCGIVLEKYYDITTGIDFVFVFVGLFRRSFNVDYGFSTCTARSKYWMRIHVSFVKPKRGPRHYICYGRTLYEPSIRDMKRVERRQK